MRPTIRYKMRSGLRACGLLLIAARILCIVVWLGLDRKGVFILSVGYCKDTFAIDIVVRAFICLKQDAV